MKILCLVKFGRFKILSYLELFCTNLISLHPLYLCTSIFIRTELLHLEKPPRNVGSATFTMVRHCWSSPGWRQVSWEMHFREVGNHIHVSHVFPFRSHPCISGYCSWIWQLGLTLDKYDHKAYLSA